MISRLSWTRTMEPTRLWLQFKSFEIFGWQHPSFSIPKWSAQWNIVSGVGKVHVSRKSPMYDTRAVTNQACSFSSQARVHTFKKLTHFILVGWTELRIGIHISTKLLYDYPIFLKHNSTNREITQVISA